jgi:hypothetical protein
VTAHVLGPLFGTFGECSRAEIRASDPTPSLAAFAALDGPFKPEVLACPAAAPNTYRLDVPATWRVFPEFNLTSNAGLRPYLRGPRRRARRAGPARCRRGPGGPARAPAVQELLTGKFRMRYGRPHVLVRWAGRDASGDTWEPLERLTNCEAALIAFEQATGRALPRPAPSPPTAAAQPPPLRVPPTARVSPSTLPRRGTWQSRPGRRSSRWPGSRGPAAALLVAAGRWLAARHRRPSLPARRVLARGGIHAPDVSAARHGGLGLAARLPGRLLP